MIEFYAIFSLIIKYIIPISVVGLIILILVIREIIHYFKNRKKYKLLKDNGFKKYTAVTSSGYLGPVYTWKKKSTNQEISERKLEYTSYKQLENFVYYELRSIRGNNGLQDKHV